MLTRITVFARSGRMAGRTGRLVAVVAAVFVVGWSHQLHSRTEARDGPFGPEGPRMREQLWIMPSGDPTVGMRATVFRPADSGGQSRRPLVLINHGTDAATRESVAMPIFYWLSKWFVDRGYVVVLPQRRGHGATGGMLAEAVDSCASPDHAASGMTAADDIAAALGYMSRQPFVDPGKTIVVGISSGGWASLALAARNPANVSHIVNFAGGRGAYANGRPNSICGARGLIEAAARFGARSRIPTLWLYASNDSYFSPGLARSMASAWTGSGGTASLQILPAYRSEGHSIADDRSGWALWGEHLERFIGRGAWQADTASLH